MANGHRQLRQLRQVSDSYSHSERHLLVFKFYIFLPQELKGNRNLEHTTAQEMRGIGVRHARVCHEVTGNVEL